MFLKSENQSGIRSCQLCDESLTTTQPALVLLAFRVTEKVNVASGSMFFPTGLG